MQTWKDEAECSISHDIRAVHCHDIVDCIRLKTFICAHVIYDLRAVVDKFGVARIRGIHRRLRGRSGCVFIYLFFVGSLTIRLTCLAQFLFPLFILRFGEGVLGFGVWTTSTFVAGRECGRRKRGHCR